MPASSGHHHRERNRAVDVTGDRGRLTGSKDEHDALREPRGPVAPLWSRIVRAALEQQVRSELGALHQRKGSWGPKKGQYNVRCACGWQIGPTDFHRANAQFKDHVQRVVAAEVVRRRGGWRTIKQRLR